jgi:hypothetical protein
MPDEILKDIFNKYLPYEIDMLRDTYRMLAEAPTDVHKNALIEAFCVHARNLIDFFMCRKSGDAVVTEFTTGFIRQLDDTVDPLKTIRTRMNKQIFHMTKVRTIMNADQFDLGRDGTESGHGRGLQRPGR